MGFLVFRLIVVVTRIYSTLMSVCPDIDGEESG